MKKKLTNIEAILLIGIIIKVFGLIYRILLTRYLTIEGMRLMSLIFPTLSLILCLSSLSVATVVNQNIASKIASGKTILKSAFRITFTSSSIIAILLLFSFPLYKILYQNTFIYYPLLVCIPLIYLSNISGIMKGYLEANNQFKTTYFSNFYEQIAKFIFTLSMLLLFRHFSLEIKVLICFLAMMLSEVVSFLYLYFKIKKKRKLYYKSVQTNGYEKIMLKQALPLTFDQLVITITAYFEPLLFYYAMGKTGVSLYDATIFYTKVTSYAIPLLIFSYFGVTNIAKFAFPKITQNKDSSKLQLILAKTFFITLLISVFNFILSQFYAEKILQFIYHDSSAKGIAQTLAFFYLFYFFNPLFVVILQAYKKEKKLLISSIISSVILLLAVLIGSLLWGEKGFLLAIMIGNSTRTILLFYYAHQCVSFSFPKRKLFLCSILIFCYVALNYWFSNVWCLAISTLFCALLALFLYYYFFGNKKEFDDDKMHK